MAESAHVTSIEAIVRFAAALRQFDDDASGALLSLDQQINRALYWLDHEQPMYWRQQIRRCYDEVARTRTAWENCLLRTVAGDRPSWLEEEKAHRKAKKQLEIALEKQELIRRWSIKVHQEVDEYRGRPGGLRRVFDGEIPKTLGLLERTATTLESYAEHSRGPDSSNEPASGENQ